MLMGLLVESGHNPASLLKDFFRSPGIVSLLVDSIRTPSGGYLEYTWSLTGFLGNTQLLHLKRGPGGLQMDSRYCIRSLPGLPMESIRICGSV
jgi:hypothetical protein